MTAPRVELAPSARVGGPHRHLGPAGPLHASSPPPGGTRSREDDRSRAASQDVRRCAAPIPLEGGSAGPVATDHLMRSVEGRHPCGCRPSYVVLANYRDRTSRSPRVSETMITDVVRSATDGRTPTSAKRSRVDLAWWRARRRVKDRATTRRSSAVESPGAWWRARRRVKDRASTRSSRAAETPCTLVARPPARERLGEHSVVERSRDHSVIMVSTTLDQRLVSSLFQLRADPGDGGLDYARPPIGIATRAQPRGDPLPADRRPPSASEAGAEPGVPSR